VHSQSISGIDPSCAPSLGLLGAGMGSGLAATGFLTLVVDLPGLGPQGPAALFVRKDSGRAALDGARAAERLSEGLGVPISKKTLLTGLSLGGYSTLAAAHERPDYAPELDIRGIAAAAPPTDLRPALNHTLTTAGSYTVVYSALALYAWQIFYGLRTDPFLLDPYWSTAPEIFSECVIKPGDGAEGPVWDAFEYDPTKVFAAPILAAAAQDTWAEPWATLLAGNTPEPAPGGPPIAVFQGGADESVLPGLTETWVERMRAAGIAIEYYVYPDGTHTSTALGPITTVQTSGDDALGWLATRLLD
jgi:pimeloyl-ACP methyl ester carboxylesterase